MGKHVSWRYKKVPHQQQFHEDIKSKYLHLSGGFGSGKSYGLIMKAFQLSYINRDVPGGMMCPTYGEFKRDVLPLTEEILDTHRIKYDFVNMKFRFPWSKAPMYVVTGNKKIRGPNWGWGVINELTLIPYIRYREFIGRVRLKRAVCPQIASCGTPEGYGSDYYEHLIEKPFSDKIKVVYGSTRANAHNLSEDYIPSLTSAFDKVMLDAYLEGLFVNMLGNRFYYNYTEKNEDRTILPFDRENLEPVLVSLDFNVEHMTAGVWRYDGFRLQGIDEIVIPNNADTDKMCQAMKERGYFPDNTTIYPDTSGKNRRTSGKTDIEIIRGHGYSNIEYKSQAPQFRVRQLNGNNLLEKKRIKIHPDRMPTHKRDFLAVTQDPGTLQKVKDNPKLTHASDGFDYMTDLLFPFSGRRSGVIVQRGYR